MKFLRPILSLMLVLVTTLLVSCSGPQAQIPTTYSPEKIAQLQVYVQPIEAAREQMENLGTLISEQNWVDTITLLHGPLGHLRADMLGFSRSLLPKDQKPAAELAREIFSHLERLDTAAKERLVSPATTQYKEALKDFDAFLNLVPKAS